MKYIVDLALTAAIIATPQPRYHVLLAHLDDKPYASVTATSRIGTWVMWSREGEENLPQAREVAATGNSCSRYKEDQERIRRALERLRQ